MATENRILTVEFEGEHRVKANSLWQWDYGQTLVFADLSLPSVYEVHFSNNPMGTSKTMIGTESGVSIPDEYLEKPASVYAWVYLHDGSTDGETEYMCEIPVLRRAKPENVSVTGDEQRTFTQMMAALGDALNNAEATAEAYVNLAMNNKVDKVAGKGLSQENFTTELKNKLESIEAGAGSHVNADWNAVSGKAQILNKPKNLVSDANYVHTDANFTQAEKNKLANLEAGATKTTVDSGMSGTSTNPVQNRIVKGELEKKVNKTDVDSSLSLTSYNPVQNRTVTSALNTKVDKVSGKELSTNDFTDALKTKLQGIEAGAQKNVQSDWKATKGDEMILNKPQNLVQDAAYVHTDQNFTKKLKDKLDGIEERANRTIVDPVLSYTSTNPIQNKVIADVLKKYGVGLSFKHDGTSYAIYLMGPDGKQLGGAIPIGSAAEVMVYDVDDFLTEFGEKPVRGNAIYAALKQLAYEDFSIHLVNPDGNRVGSGAVIGDSKIALKHAQALGYTGDEEYYDTIYEITQDFESIQKYHDHYFIGTTLYLNRGQFAGTTLFL